MFDPTPAESSIHAPQPWFARRGLAVARWIASVALLAAMPKCVLCLAGYLGLAASFGMTRGEFCGGSSAGGDFSSWTVHAFIVVGLGLIGVWGVRHFFILVRALLSGTKRVVR